MGIGKTKYHIIAGEMRGRYKLIEEVKSDKPGRHVLCMCACGNERIVSLASLLAGTSKSCGCLKSDLVRKRASKHGLYETRIYSIWKGMKDRCFNVKSAVYHHYGGRGISICAEWLNVTNFYEWSMRNGYKDLLTIERVDNNGDYSPDNCAWIPLVLQNKNTRKTVRYTYRNKSYTKYELSSIANMKPETLRGRIRMGWSVDDAVNTPVDIKFRNKHANTNSR